MFKNIFALFSLCLIFALPIIAQEEEISEEHAISIGNMMGDMTGTASAEFWLRETPRSSILVNAEALVRPEEAERDWERPTISESGQIRLRFSLHALDRLDKAFDFAPRESTVMDFGNHLAAQTLETMEADSAASETTIDVSSVEIADYQASHYKWIDTDGVLHNTYVLPLDEIVFGVVTSEMLADDADADRFNEEVEAVIATIAFEAGYELGSTAPREGLYSGSNGLVSLSFSVIGDEIHDLRFQRTIGLDRCTLTRNESFPIISELQMAAWNTPVNIVSTSPLGAVGVVLSFHGEVANAYVDAPLTCNSITSPSDATLTVTYQER